MAAQALAALQTNSKQELQQETDRAVRAMAVLQRQENGGAEPGVTGPQAPAQPFPKSQPYGWRQQLAPSFCRTR